MQVEAIKESFNNEVGVVPAKVEMIRGTIYATTPQGKTYTCRLTASGKPVKNSWRPE